MRRSSGALVAGLALALLGAAASSCRPPVEAEDPIASLASPVPSARWGEEFWDGEAEKDTGVWREALGFCRGKATDDLPNCATVLSVYFLRRLEAGSRAEGERRDDHSTAAGADSGPPADF